MKSNSLVQPEEDPLCATWGMDGDEPDPHTFLPGALVLGVGGCRGAEKAGLCGCHGEACSSAHGPLC